ncbi:hypothetical protein OQY15_04695 [Pedobacter sp. MC2016-15]|uniref:hypothetical protein n=1 Tax=Pedobacter sp. MC2016-15 TaxID=2994473 RepID=UPI0022460431|nr:hypothetical protein [Pedobacter sp. MC2016-15]MCX2478376.1 hypothetical protein [Pedobacter sp. MC2016-15]
MNIERYNLNNNPFRMTPATNPEELFWAGFPEVKSKFESRITRSVNLNNSSLILNWGEYGSGKTHAARYFNKTSVLQPIADSAGKTIPYSMVMLLPKGRDPIHNIFTNIVDKIDISEIRDNLRAKGVEIESVIDNFTDNNHIRSVLKAMFNHELTDISLLKKYLYGNVPAAELKSLSKWNILRSLNAESDYTKVLAGLFTCLSFEKKMYSAVILWIDEFEDIATLNSSSIDKINNFLREIIDNTSNNLLLFLNLTQSAIFGLEDLGEYVSESVRSRIKDRISFEIPTRDQILSYLSELIAFYRKEKDKGPYFPFTVEVISAVLDDIGNVPLRTVNEAFSLLIEIGLMDGKDEISLELYEQNKGDIIGWKQ